MKLNIIGILTLVAINGINANEELLESELTFSSNSSDRFIDVVNYLAERSNQDFLLAGEEGGAASFLRS